MTWDHRLMLPITIICVYAQLTPQLETSNEAWIPCCQFTSVVLGSNPGEDVDAGRVDLYCQREVVTRSLKARHRF